MNAPSHKKVGFDRHVAGLHRLHKIIQDLIGNSLVKRPFITIAPEIELEAFQFHAKFVGHVRNMDRRKIWLAGLGTKAREFRTFHLNIVIPAGIRIFEDLEFLRRLHRHLLKEKNLRIVGADYSIVW